MRCERGARLGGLCVRVGPQHAGVLPRWLPLWLLRLGVPGALLPLCTLRPAARSGVLPSAGSAAEVVALMSESPVAVVASWLTLVAIKQEAAA